MRLIDIAIPKSEEPPADDVAAKAPPRSSEFPPANEPQDFDDGASFLTDATDLRRDDDGDFHDAVGENNDVSPIACVPYRILTECLPPESGPSVQAKDFRTRIRGGGAESFSVEVCAQCRRSSTRYGGFQWLCSGSRHPPIRHVCQFGSEDAVFRHAST